MSRTIYLGQLRIRFNLLIATCVALAFLLFVNLGFWQLGRAEEKRQLLLEQQEQEARSALPIESVLSGGVGKGDSPARVSLRGSFLNEQAVHLAYQFFQGQPGYEIVVPFRLSSGGTVLVSRGWAPGGQPDGLPRISAVTGEQLLFADLHEVPAPAPSMVETARSSSPGERDWPLWLRQLDTALIEEKLQRPIPNVVARLAPASPGVLVRHWPAVTADTGTNIGYAVQWFVFALAVLVVALLLSTNLIDLMRGGDRSV